MDGSASKNAFLCSKCDSKEVGEIRSRRLSPYRELSSSRSAKLLINLPSPSILKRLYLIALILSWVPLTKSSVSSHIPMLELKATSKFRTENFRRLVTSVSSVISSTLNSRRLFYGQASFCCLWCSSPNIISFFYLLFIQ